MSVPHPDGMRCAVCNVDVPWAEVIEHNGSPGHQRNLHPVSQADYDMEEDE